jgi:hypothetical protein
MKLSISLPDSIAREIKKLSAETERDVSWWIRKAWETARTQLMRGDQSREAERKALKKLASLRGALKKDYSNTDSVSLAHSAFSKKS